MKKYTIFAGSTDKDKIFIQQHLDKDSVLICADSGAVLAYDLALTPDVIIGDFDSVPAHVLAHYRDLGQTKIMAESDQNTNDLQKALNLVPDHAQEVSIYGALGGRMDHVFANILILEQYNEPMRFALYDGNHTIRILNHDFTFQGQIGDKVGLLPIRPIDHLEYEGLKYPASGIKGPYELGWLGTSNILEREHATIKIMGGAAILVHYKETVDDPAA